MEKTVEKSAGIGTVEKDADSVANLGRNVIGMKKVLTLNWGHGPYSISKIVRDMEEILKKEEIEFLHVQESGQTIGDNYIRLSGWLMTRVYYLWAHISGRQYGTGYIPYLKWKKILKKYSPDVVHIHCPNGFSINLYKVLELLKQQKIPTVITNHAEFFYTGNCAHAEDCLGFITGCKDCKDFKRKTSSLFFNRTEWAWKKMERAFRGFQHIKMVAVSPWVLGRMKKSPIVNSLPMCVIGNGVNTKIFRMMENRVKEGNRKTVLHVTANFSSDENKGGKYVLQLARMCEELPIDFVVVGGSSLSGLPEMKNITFAGEISDQSALAEYYRRADATLITSKRETFGMVCAESLCCGTPVVGFLNGGTESIALPEYTSFVPFGDLEMLKKELLSVLQADFIEQEISEKACKAYSKEQMAFSYLEVYREVMRK